MDEERLNEAIQNAVNSFGTASGAVNQLAESLAQVARNNTTAANAATTAANAMNGIKNVSDALVQGFGGLVSAFTSLAMSLSGVTANVYGAEKAFESVIPTVDAVSGLMAKMVEAAGLAASGMTALGFSLGRAPEAISKFVVTGIELVQNLINFQLQTAQRVADTFINVNKAGALYSASIDKFAEDAARAAVPMQALGRIIVENIDKLSKLGLGVSEAGLRVTALSKEIFDTNDALVATYGSLEALGSGVADYLALQAQLGVDARKYNKLNKTEIEEYLLRQRELSAITGKNAELLKKEEEGRRRQLDYNLKLGRLGEIARANVQEGMAVAGKIFGDAGAKYAEEYFATGGKVYSAEALRYQAMNMEAANSIAVLMGSVDQSTEGYRKGYTSYLQANAAILEGVAKSNEDLAEINRAANNPILRSMTETSSSILENLTLIKNATNIIRELENQRAETTKKELDPATKGFVEATRAMIDNQREIDDMVRRNMKDMTGLVQMMFDLQKSLIQTQGAATAAFNSLVNSTILGGTEGDAAARVVVEELLKKLMTAVREQQIPVQQPEPAPVNTRPSQAQQQTPAAAQPATPATPQAPATPAPQNPQRQQEQNLPRQAEGGVTSGPTLTGEDGPEAVIPLKSGNVPLNIDFGPVLNVLDVNNKLTEELIGVLEDTKNVQEKILAASY